MRKLTVYSLQFTVYSFVFFTVRFQDAGETVTFTKNQSKCMRKVTVYSLFFLRSPTQTVTFENLVYTLQSFFDRNETEGYIFKPFVKMKVYSLVKVYAYTLILECMSKVTITIIFTISAIDIVVKIFVRRWNYRISNQKWLWYRWAFFNVTMSNLQLYDIKLDFTSVVKWAIYLLWSAHHVICLSDVVLNYWQLMM